MTVIIHPEEIKKGDKFGIAWDRGGVFNLQFLSAALGLSEKGTKAWCKYHGVEPDIDGNEWLFTVSSFEKCVMEAKHLNDDEEEIEEE